MAKKEKIEGRKRRKESLYALLLVLWLVVTKESIKIAHNLASEVYQRKLKEKRDREGTQPWHTNAPWNMKKWHTMKPSPKKQQSVCVTNRQMLKIRGGVDKVNSQQAGKKTLWCDVIANTQQLHRRKVREDRSLVTTHIQRQMKHHSRTFISLI